MSKIIIIGSGMAGLTAGAYLSKSGYDVIIYEQNSMIGGSAGTLTQDGFSWDLGPMLIEGLAPHEKLGRILKELNLCDKLKLIRDERGQSFIDFDLNSPPQYQGLYWRRDLLKQRYPQEKKGLDRYYQFHNRIMKLLYLGNQIDFLIGVPSLINKLRLLFTFLPIKKYEKWTADKLMDFFFKDPTLKTVFLGILADMTVKPSEFIGIGVPTFNPETVYDKRIPIVYKGFKFPTYHYIQNGCGQLPNLLRDFITEHGGKIILKTKVNKILIENSRITGIQLDSGEKIKADIVLTSGDPIGSRTWELAATFITRIPYSNCSRVLVTIYW